MTFISLLSRDFYLRFILKKIVYKNSFDARSRNHNQAKISVSQQEAGNGVHVRINLPKFAY